LQHVRYGAARRAVLSATADPSLECGFLLTVFKISQRKTTAKEAMLLSVEHDVCPMLFLWPLYVIGGGHYIFDLWFLSSIYLSFFPRLILAAGDWMSTILPHMVWP